MDEIKLPTYYEHIKEFSRNIIGRIHVYEKMERDGDLPRGQAEILVQGVVENHIHLLVNTLVRIQEYDRLPAEERERRKQEGVEARLKLVEILANGR